MEPLVTLPATALAGECAAGSGECAAGRARAEERTRATAHAWDGVRGGRRRATEVGAPAYTLVGPPGPANSVLINFLSAAKVLLQIVLDVSARLSTALVQFILQNHFISEASTQ